MVGIASVAYRLARTTTTIDEWCARQNLPEERRDALTRNGAERFHHVDGEGLVDLAVGAVLRLIESAQVATTDIHALIVCHTSPLNVLPAPHTLAGTVRQRCRLCNSLAFSITQQQCVSPLHALRVLDGLFATHRDWQSALVLSADLIMREELRAIGDAGIHSDGASAMLVRRKAPSTVCGLSTYNDLHTGWGSSPSAIYEDNANYVWTLISVIRRVLRAASVSASDLVTVIPHNVNQPTWRQVLNTLHIPQERLFHRNFARIGHVFGSDPAINILDSNALQTPGDHLVFTSGIGGSFGGFILRTEMVA